MKIAKAKGRLQDKQPKRKPNQAAHLLELHDLGIYTQAELAERRCTGPSSECDPYHEDGLTRRCGGESMNAADRAGEPAGRAASVRA